jgi:hypothetical protein
MSRLRIVCVDRETNASGHEHIAAVGVGSDPGQADDGKTVREVRQAMAHGDQFYTVSPSTGKEAAVEQYRCEMCNFEAIRSEEDRIADNNLDNLRACRGFGDD